MKISIITPTLQRDSLRRCSESVDRQSYEDWEHLVCIDGRTVYGDIEDSLSHARRAFFVTDSTRNFGNHQRHYAWKHATGDFVLYLDDDNYLADDHVLGDLAVALSKVPHWAVFPILRHGHRFFYDPPGNCFVDTANMVICREIAQWPDGPEYTMDGLFCEQLKSKYPYVAFPEFRPIVVMETSRRGE